MRKSLTLTFLALMLFMTGCIQSLHPLYTEPDLIFDPTLIGEWTDKEGKETWAFTKSAEKDYKLEYIDKDGKKGEFDVHLLKVKNRRFLDFFPADPDLKQNDFYQAHILPVHTFVQVQQIEPTLQMAMMESDWIKKFLQKNPDAIKHEKVDDTIVLTAQPKELQAFLIKHEKTPDAWGECTNLSRRVGSPKD